MLQQQSFSQQTKGCLYLVPTPIGNLADMTYRAVDILKSSDMILAEDTRQTGKLLAHYNIQQSMQSFHEHTHAEQVDRLVQEMLDGKQLALVSDAGMPLINDPGHPLVQACIDHQIAVVALPGANAALTALIASGLTANQFTYYGFFPRKTKDQHSLLKIIGKRTETALFYESPHRITASLKQIAKSLGDNCQVVVARELTKRYETYLRGHVGDIIEFVESHPLKGEIVLMIAGGDLIDSAVVEDFSDVSLKAHVIQYIEGQGMTAKEAIKQVTKIRNVPRKQVYNAYHDIE